MSDFGKAKLDFDSKYSGTNILETSLVPVHGKIKNNILIRNKKLLPNEEYYKWQFIYSVIYSGLCAKDYIGVEVYFPKGSAGAEPIKIDGAIFDDSAWLNYYNSYWASKKSSDLEWLKSHLLAVIEFKNRDIDIERTLNGQVKPAMNEKYPSIAYVLGIYYDKEELFLFHRRDGLILRYDEAKNQKGDESKTSDLSLQIPDPYYFIPSFKELKNQISKVESFDKSKRTIFDLDIIKSITTTQLKTAFSDVLRALEKASLTDQRGYNILIEAFAIKIFDEKYNEKYPNKYLEFYINNNELDFKNLSEKGIQTFISRIKGIREKAEVEYQTILEKNSIDWKNLNHVRVVCSICLAFQDFSFIKSEKSNLYQLIFYNFANSYTLNQYAQFLTPLPVIEFLVKIVNPRGQDTILDPCCGIGDFLSLSYVNSQEKKKHLKLNEHNIFGVDRDDNMITLATLNMLLNGDGESKLFHSPDKGSIVSKVVMHNPPKLVSLIPEYHKDGNWDNWPDNTKLQKFKVILTNPPFGEDRAYRPVTAQDKAIIETYETWKFSSSKSIDLGVVFLENAYHCLDNEGRLGIILSNSIASIDQWQEVRKWFLDKMRIVALFDIPPNVFAETGVNTTLIVAYKPSPEKLKDLQESNHSVFVRDIKNVGYEKRTSKRNIFFNTIYEIDEDDFTIKTDADGKPIVKEDFSQVLEDFRQWARGQEEALQRIFIWED